jgi:hypothetical protein
MKKKQTIIVIGVLLIGLVFSGAALAAGKGGGADSGFRHRMARGQDEFGPLTHYIKQNLTVSVLAEMSRQPTDTIRQKLKDQRMRALLEEYNIDREAFRTAMKAKVDNLVQNLVAGGFITKEQAKEFGERGERRAERGEIMKQLIEKGLADGTITAEQAQMLQHKRFKD